MRLRSRRLVPHPAGGPTELRYRHTQRGAIHGAFALRRIRARFHPLAEGARWLPRQGGGACRLAGVELPKYPDEEKTFAELSERIAKTLGFLGSLNKSQFDGAETRDIVMSIRGEERRFVGQPFLLHNAMPNFFFHVTTAYAILRHNGVELGKMDFIG